MSSLLVVTGPPGAGKSTVAAELAQRTSPSVLVHGDDFFGFLAAGAIEPWLPESNTQNGIVTEAAARATGRFAADYDTIYEGVLGPWFLPTFAAASGLATLNYVIILPPVETCVSRIGSRVGHEFSNEAAARKMHEEFAKASIPARHVLEQGDVELEQTVAAIAEARDLGQLRYDVST